MLSFRLSGRRWPTAALNLYADQVGVFDLAGRTTAALFADQAAIALHGAEHAAALDRALASRDVIGQAKGILIGRHHLTAEDAFRMLVEASQHANLKLRDVADWLISEAHAPGTGRVERGVRAEPRPLTSSQDPNPGRGLARQRVASGRAVG